MRATTTSTCSQTKVSTDEFARAFGRTLEGLSDEEREAKKQKFQEFVDQERVFKRPQASPQLSTAPPAR